MLKQSLTIDFSQEAFRTIIGKHAMAQTFQTFTKYGPGVTIYLTGRSCVNAPPVSSHWSCSHGETHDAYYNICNEYFTGETYQTIDGVFQIGRGLIWGPPSYLNPHARMRFHETILGINNESQKIANSGMFNVIAP